MNILNGALAGILLGFAGVFAYVAWEIATGRRVLWKDSSKRTRIFWMVVYAALALTNAVVGLRTLVGG